MLYTQNASEKMEIIKQTKIINTYLITALFIYAVLIIRGLKSGGTLHIMIYVPSPKHGGQVSLGQVSPVPRELTHDCDAGFVSFRSHTHNFISPHMW